MEGTNDGESVSIDVVQQHEVIAAVEGAGSREEAIRILYELFCLYDAGYEVTGEADFLLNDEAYYSEYEEAARPLERV